MSECANMSIRTLEVNDILMIRYFHIKGDIGSYVNNSVEGRRKIY